MSKFKSVEIKALAAALTVSFILCLLVAPIVYYTGLKETLLAPWGKIILAISVFGAASYVSKHYGNKGLVRGMTMGVLFFILMFIVTFIIEQISY